MDLSKLKLTSRAPIFGLPLGQIKIRFSARETAPSFHRDRSRWSRWDARSKTSARALRAMHGSSGIIATIHCFRVVVSMNRAPQSCIFVWLLASPRHSGCIFRKTGFMAGTQRAPCLHFGRTFWIFMNENNSERNHLWCGGPARSTVNPLAPACGLTLPRVPGSALP